MELKNGRIEGRLSGLKSALAGFCPAIKRLSKVPCLAVLNRALSPIILACFAVLVLCGPVFAGWYSNEFVMDVPMGHSLGLRDQNIDQFKINFTAQNSTPVAKVYFVFNRSDADDDILITIRNSAGVAIATATANVDATSTGIGWYSAAIGTSWDEAIQAGQMYSIVFKKTAVSAGADNNIVTAFGPASTVGLYNGGFFNDANIGLYYSDAAVEAWGSAPANAQPIFIVEYADGKLQGCPYATGHFNAGTDPSNTPDGFVAGTDAATAIYETRLGRTNMTGFEFTAGSDMGITQWTFWKTRRGARGNRKHLVSRGKNKR